MQGTSSNSNKLNYLKVDSEEDSVETIGDWGHYGVTTQPLDIESQRRIEEDVYPFQADNRRFGRRHHLISPYSRVGSPLMPRCWLG